MKRILYAILLFSSTDAIAEQRQIDSLPALHAVYSNYTKVYPNVEIPEIHLTPGNYPPIRPVPSVYTGIRIHCNRSFVKSKDPLYIVDGKLYSNNKLLKKISPDSIKSVTVIKDAEATALYGSAGAAGVIIITTTNPPKQGAKKGQKQ